MKTDLVDVFWGCERSIPERNLLASKWFFLKAQAGNLSPGASLPFGFITAHPYTGGYPSGSTPYQVNTKGIPEELPGTRNIKGFSHVQQSGTGAIKHYYNYVLVTPGRETELEADSGVPLTEETGTPGLYEARLANGVHARLTVSRFAAVHDYGIPDRVGGVSIDFGHHGLLTYQRETPGSVDMHIRGNLIDAHITYDDLELYVAVRSVTPGSWESASGSRAYFRPDKMAERTTNGNTAVELRIGFSLVDADMAMNHLAAIEQLSFDRVASAARAAWEELLGIFDVSGDRADIFYSALYHAVKKPVDLCEHSSTPARSHRYADFATLWDQYKTQLPLLSLIAPDRYAGMMHTLIDTFDRNGAFPGGVVVRSEGAEAFSNQAKALPHVVLAQAYFSGVQGIDYARAVPAMRGDLLRPDNYQTITHPESSTRMTHLLDLSEGISHTVRLARAIGLPSAATGLEEHRELWRHAYDDGTGLLKERNGDLTCEYYEGINWNYSFRLLHRIKERISITGRERFVELLDHFFGFDRPPVRQPIDPAASADYGAVYHSFEGLNNEPDMETPFNYHFVGRTDRTYEIIDTIMNCQFLRGRNGVPGNDDSGGLSSWYVWNAMGLFPVSGHNALLIGTPFLDRVTLTAGKPFTILRRGDRGPYVAEARLDGKPLDRLFVTYDEVRSGGELALSMSDDATDTIRGRAPTLMSD